jgi:hypothetical protein
MKTTVKRVEDRIELRTAIETALRECKDPYAQTYLQALPRSYEEYGEYGVGVQLLYCLNNMSTWRGETARETKKIFKKWAKILQ